MNTILVDVFSVDASIGSVNWCTKTVAMRDDEKLSRCVPIDEHGIAGTYLRGRLHDKLLPEMLTSIIMSTPFRHLQLQLSILLPY